MRTHKQKFIIFLTKTTELPKKKLEDLGIFMEAFGKFIETLDGQGCFRETLHDSSENLVGKSNDCDSFLNGLTIGKLVTLLYIRTLIATHTKS